MVASKIATDEASQERVCFQLKAESSDGKEHINLEFTKADFLEVEDAETAENMMKVVAFDKINRAESADERKRFSLEYQVLCEETAIVGVLKQQDKSSGEMVESTIAFEKVEAYRPPPPQPVSEQLLSARSNLAADYGASF